MISKLLKTYKQSHHQHSLKSNSRVFQSLSAFQQPNLQTETKPTLVNSF